MFPGAGLEMRYRISGIRGCHPCRPRSLPSSRTVEGAKVLINPPVMDFKGMSPKKKDDLIGCNGTQWDT